jgi:hypothetical protein
MAYNIWRKRAGPGWQEKDRDVTVKNTRWMQDFRSPRRPSHEKRREGMKVNARPERLFINICCKLKFKIKREQFFK